MDGIREFNSLLTCFILVFFSSWLVIIFFWFEKEMGGSLIDDLKDLFKDEKKSTRDSKKRIR